jgi:hypothetical protein
MTALTAGRIELTRRTLGACALAAFVALLAACSSGGAGNGVAIGSGQSTNDPVAPDFPIAYVRRPLRDTTDPTVDPLEDDPRVQRVWNGPADVFVRERASPSALEKNVTERITKGTWDVRDLEPSFDGKKLLFSMRAPLRQNARESQQPKWAIYEYDLEKDTLRRVIQSDIVAGQGHDVSPHYLPDGRILFSSSRQRGSAAILIDEGKSQYAQGIEGNRNLPAFVLHVMNPDGTNIKQISYNRNHDLDPTLLPTGEVLFTRWDNYAAGNVGMHFYTMNPDGSTLQLLYGRNSHLTGTVDPATGLPSAVQFLQPRPRPDGKVVALVRPFTNTEFGGDAVLIDVGNYVENTQASGNNPGGRGPAQSRLVVNDVRTIAGPSPGGRYSSVFPLWDGTNRLLVSWTLCRVIDQTRIVPCTSSALSQPNVQTAPPLYGVFIYDPAQNTQLPIVAPVEGVMFTDVVALQPRTPPPAALPDAVAGIDYSAALATEGVGILNIRSVYDYDGCDRSDSSAGCASPPTGTALAGAVAGGIRTLRDPTLSQASRRPARFLRIEKAVGLPDREVLDQLPAYAFGVAGGGFGMRELLGYVPIEPDGSVRVKVPANVALDISVLDANGRRISSRHRNWLQVRTGEVLTCNGCHVQTNGTAAQPSTSHGRIGLFPSANPGAPSTGQPFPGTALRIADTTGALVATAVRPDAGETMAEYRARSQLACTARPCAMTPSMNVLFDDVWTATSPGTGGNSSFAFLYAQLATPIPTDCVDRWEARCRGVIHYPTHISPLWTRPRVEFAADGVTVLSDHTCVSCHSPTDAANARRVPAGQLDLTNGPGDINQLRMKSFEQLLFTRQALQLNMGALQPILVPGPIDPVTGLPTLVPLDLQPPMSGGGANASTRFFSRFAPGATHFDAAAGLPWLDPAELRLVSEWLDLGGQYYNDPFAVPVQ